MSSDKKFRVVKTLIKTGCDLEREVIKSNLPKGKAEALKASLEAKLDAEDFDPRQLLCFTVEPAA